MNRYGLGVELTTAVVRWSTATSITGVGAVTEFAPMAVVVDGRSIGGAAALVPAATTPANVINDIVGQFTVDRLWFTGGVMLTTDDALRAVIVGCINDARLVIGAPPDAVTVSCPPQWDADAAGRVAALLAATALPLQAVRHGLAATAAAADAAARLPERVAVEFGDSDLPPLSIGRALPPPVMVHEPQSPPPQAARRRRRAGWVVWLALVLGIPAIVFIAIRASRDPKPSNSPGTRPADTQPAGTSPLATGGPTATAQAPALLASFTLGLMSSGDAALEQSVRAAVDEIGGDTQAYRSGAFLVVQPFGADPAEVIRQLLGQGVAALVTDAAGTQLSAVLGAAQAVQMPICVVGADNAQTMHGPGIAAGDPTSCTAFLGLAALYAGSAIPSRVADAMAVIGNGGGLQCSSFTQCAAYLSAGQPISFVPDSGPVRLAPNA